MAIQQVKTLTILFIDLNLRWSNNSKTFEVYSFLLPPPYYTCTHTPPKRAHGTTLKNEFYRFTMKWKKYLKVTHLWNSFEVEPHLNYYWQKLYPLFFAKLSHDCVPLCSSGFGSKVFPEYSIIYDGLKLIID